MQSCEQRQHPWLCDAIIDRLRTLAGRNQALRAKLGEVLGQGRLAKADPADQFANREFTFFAKVTKYQ